jgi:hypothetical protein
MLHMFYDVHLLAILVSLDPTDAAAQNASQVVTGSDFTMRFWEHMSVNDFVSKFRVLTM